MHIATFQATCQNQNCQHNFEVPQLSDFSYGEHLYHSIDGLDHQYLNSMDHQVWDQVATTVSSIFSTKDQVKIGGTIQKIIGLIADRKAPDTYYSLLERCPKCQSTDLFIDENNKTGSMEVSHLSFHRYTHLSESDRIRLILPHIT